MKTVQASPAIAAQIAADEGIRFGPVIADRIARIRARLASGLYPLDVVTLAATLVDFRDGEPTVTHKTVVSSSVAAAVAARLAEAIGTMDSGAMLILQLEFVEQLERAEIAALFGIDAMTIDAVRRTALTILSGQMSQTYR